MQRPFDLERNSDDHILDVTISALLFIFITHIRYEQWVFNSIIIHKTCCKSSYYNVHK